MHDIYRSLTPRQPGYVQQEIDATLVVENDSGNRRLRITVHFDTSHGFQCHGQIAVLTENDTFQPVLNLHTHEIPFVCEYDAMELRDRGDLLRKNGEFERRMHEALDQLARLGFKVIGQGA